LIGLVIVGLVAVSFLLPDGPLTSKATLPPSSQVAIASATPTAPAASASSSPTSTNGVVVVPSLDASPVASEAPTAAPPTPTLAPGATPRPTAKPTPTPKVTPRPTPGPTPPPGSPTMTIFVNVTNNDGGAAVPSNWLIDFGGGSASPSSFVGSSAGTLVSVAAGKSYQIFDTARVTEAVGYTATRSANCASATGGLLVAGQHYTCTITQNDKPAQVKVVTVVNGPDAPSAWDVSVTGTGVSPAGTVAGSSSGVTFSFDAHASFDVQQSGPAGYDAPNTSGTCTSGGLVPGAHVTCTFTFNETPPPPTPTPDPSIAVVLFPASFLLPLRRRWRPILRT